MNENDLVIVISNFGRWEEPLWKMEINLTEVVRSAGQKIKEGAYIYVDYPMPRAKRILRLVAEYGTTDDWCAVNEAVKDHKRLAAWWRELINK